MLDRHQAVLKTGQLDITVTDEQVPLNDLLTFGARQNPKRRYLFISKVLGKYVPCRPKAMRRSYQQLAATVLKEGVQGNARVLGVAETATGLGAGVAQEVQRQANIPLLYSHTSRYELENPIDFSISETHSHAPSHLIYELEAELQSIDIETLIIVDDEISTGRTLEQLTHHLCDRNPHIKKVIWVCLVNWLSVGRQAQLRAEYPQLTLAFCSLLSGHFQFKANESVELGLPEKTATGLCSIDQSCDSGKAQRSRIGYQVSDVSQSYQFVDPKQQALTLENLDRDQAYMVIGTGEFTFQPFLFAEQMEQHGFDVLMQSTGRSPILEGEGIERKESFFDESHQGMLYLYNRCLSRHPIMLYETFDQYLKCPLRLSINATAGILTGGATAS
jgi:hypoxanthine-guanine phosphoribosyltransferase